MPQQQVYSAQEVDFGDYIKMFWAKAFAGDGSAVPASHTLEITTLTINYFPQQTGGTSGRVDIAGRDAAGIGTGSSYVETSGSLRGAQEDCPSHVPQVRGWKRVATWKSGLCRRDRARYSSRPMGF